MRLIITDKNFAAVLPFYFIYYFQLQNVLEICLFIKVNRPRQYFQRF